MKKELATTAIIIAAGALAACGSDTGRARVAFEVSVISEPLAAGPNEFGYTVQLTRAELRGARLAFFEGDPLFTKSWRQRVGEFLVPSAHAHPGHYTPGEALADLLVAQTFDLLRTDVQTWGMADGVTGDYASAELNLGTTNVAAVILEGTATGPGGEIPFVASLDESQELLGLTAGFMVDERPFEVVVNFDLNELVRRVDFGRVASPEVIASASAPIPLVRDTQPYNAFSRAAIGNLTYRFERTETVQP